MATHFSKGDGKIDTINVYVDSDWGGELAGRRSTSSGAILINDCLVHSFSRTQGVTATSSGEAEFYAIGSGLSEALMFQTVLREMLFECKIIVHSDSKAATAMSTRLGLSRAKHIEIKYLWQQDIFKHRGAKIVRVNSAENPADLGTKPLAAQTILRLSLGIRPVQRRDIKTTGLSAKITTASGVLACLVNYVN